MCDQSTLKERYEREHFKFNRWIRVLYDERHKLKKDFAVRRYIVPGGRGNKVFKEEFTMCSDIFLASGSDGKTTECYLDNKCNGRHFVSDLFNGEVWMKVSVSGDPR